MRPSNYIQKQHRTKPGNELGFSAWIKQVYRWIACFQVLLYIS